MSKFERARDAIYKYWMSHDTLEDYFESDEEYEQFMEKIRLCNNWEELGSMADAIDYTLEEILDNDQLHFMEGQYRREILTDTHTRGGKN